MRTTLAILGMLLMVLATGTSAADGVVYWGDASPHGSCNSVLDEGDLVKPDSNDCKAGTGHGETGDTVVGVNAGPLKWCYVVGSGLPHECGGFKPPIQIGIGGGLP